MSSNSIDIFNSIRKLCLEGFGFSFRPLESESLERLKTIIDTNPDAARSAIVNERDRCGETLLHFAAFHRSLEFCKVLVEMDIGQETARATNRFGCLPFHYACETHNFETAKYLYEIFPESINTPDN
jgi:ankyrin repeat protein